MAKRRKKKVTVTRSGSGGVPARTDGFKYEIGEGQTEDEYRKILDHINKQFAEAEKDFVTFNARRLVMMWDTGKRLTDFMSKKRDKHGHIPEKDVANVAADLEPFSTGQRVTKEIIRICLRVTETYPKERIETLAQKGINENHVSVFLQLEDPNIRRELEDRAVKENLNGEAVRKVVREMAKDPSKSAAIRGSSRARYRQEASKKKNARKTRIKNPAKMIDYILVKFESDADDFTDLLMSMDNVAKLEPQDRSALVEPLDRLTHRLAELVNTFNGIKDAAFSAMVVANSALAAEGKTQGVKGGEATKPAPATQASTEKTGRKSAKKTGKKTKKKVIKRGKKS